MAYKDKRRQREYQSRVQRERRAAWFAGKCCSRCGSDIKLEVHHRDPAEKDDHRVWSWSRERLDAELAKCDVVCRSCHIELHAALRRAPCGTNSAYTRGCRCVPCRTAHAEYAAAWKQARQALT